MTNQFIDQPVEVSSNSSNASTLNALELLSEKTTNQNQKCQNLPTLEFSSTNAGNKLEPANPHEITKCGPGIDSSQMPGMPETTIKPEKPIQPSKPELAEKPDKPFKPIKPELTEIEKNPSAKIAQLLMDGSIDLKDVGLIESAHSQANNERGVKGEIELLDQINQQLVSNNSPYRLRAGQNVIKTFGGRRLELVHQEARRDLGSDHEVLYQGVVDTFDFIIKNH